MVKYITTEFKPRELSWIDWISGESALVACEKLVIGNGEALWVLYENKLRYVRPLTKIKAPDADAPIRAFLYKVLNNDYYILLITIYALYPVVILIVDYSHTYADGNYEYVIVDNVFSILYVIEYSLRTYLNGLELMLKDLREVFVVLTLSLSIIFCLTTKGNFVQYQMWVCRVNVISRAFRIIVAYAQVKNYTDVAVSSLSGFIPMLLYLLTALLIYAIIGIVVFGKTRLNTGNEFVDSHYDFATLPDAITTLMIMGTGNCWTEVIQGLKSQMSQKSLGVRVLVEIYFISFYLIFVINLRLFALMIIYQYRNLAGSATGLAVEQIKDFQEHYQSCLNHSREFSIDGLFHFLSFLPPPLGPSQEGVEYMNYYDLERFAKQVLLYLPNSQFVEKLLDDSNSQQIELPKLSLRNFMQNLVKVGHVERRLVGGGVQKVSIKKKGFTFSDILYAVHKSYMFRQTLNDENAVKKTRAMAQRYFFPSLIVVVVDL